MKRILTIFITLLTMATTISAQELKSDWPIGNPNDAYAQYFTGQSYLAPHTIEGNAKLQEAYEMGKNL